MLARVTATAVAGLDPDLEPLQQVFVDPNVPVEVADWCDASVNWGRLGADGARTDHAVAVLQRE